MRTRTILEKKRGKDKAKFNAVAHFLKFFSNLIAFSVHFLITARRFLVRFCSKTCKNVPEEGFYT